MAEHEGEADRIEENAAEAGVDDTFHQHVDGFTRPAKSGFQHREADLHAEDQEGRDERPGSVDGIDTSAAFSVLSAAYTLVKNMAVIAAMTTTLSHDTGQLCPPAWWRRTSATSVDEDARSVLSAFARKIKFLLSAGWISS